jgi:excisionase family DNA binding protein
VGKGLRQQPLPRLPTREAGHNMVAETATRRQRSVSLAEYAELHGVSPWTIRRRISDGTIEAFRLGRLIRIPLDQPIGTPMGSR